MPYINPKLYAPYLLLRLYEESNGNINTYFNIYELDNQTSSIEKTGIRIQSATVGQLHDWVEYLEKRDWVTTKKNLTGQNTDIAITLDGCRIAKEIQLNPNKIP